MISKNNIKLIRSLKQKKYRLREKLFVVEGDKIVAEVLQSGYVVNHLFATDKFLSDNQSIIKVAKTITRVSENEIRIVSFLKSPQNCIALCEIPEVEKQSTALNGLHFYLDGIQDPGNLGTIIRTCDWFGINEIFCSFETVDFYNQKVIQATMGSFCRVKVRKIKISDLSVNAKKYDFQILGTFLEGQSIYNESIPENAVVILGNEGNGIHQETEKFINTKICIPSFSSGGAESLNVSISAGIICSEYKRRQIEE